MDQHTDPPKTMDSTQSEFLRQLPQEFEDLVEHWHIVRKRSCRLPEIKDLRLRTEKLVDQLRDKRVDYLLDRLRRLDEHLHFHVRRQQPLSRTDVETLTSIMMALRQAGIEEVPAELRKRALEQTRAATHSDDAPSARTPTTANPVVSMIAATAAGPSTRAEDRPPHRVLLVNADPEVRKIRTPTLDAAGRRHWSSRIRDAMLGKKLFLMFQPIFSVKGNDAIERYEVLLRIREDGGDVSLPSETLAMAEQLGMSGLLDRWVIDTALEMLSKHRKTSPNTIFFLKVTGGTIRDDRFPEWLEETVHRRALDRGSVVMQVREADAVAQRQRTQEMIRRLREHHIAAGLEHFGLRTTSFELLKSLDVDFVKLDRALVKGLAEGSKNAPSILKLLHQTRARGVTIIASHVENADSLAQLWNERIDLLQGNFLHGPDLNLAYDPVL